MTIQKRTPLTTLLGRAQMTPDQATPDRAQATLVAEIKCMCPATDLIEVEVEEGIWQTIHWPFCKVKGCPNRQWRMEQSEYCYPHSHIEIKSRYDILLNRKGVSEHDKLHGM